MRKRRGKENEERTRRKTKRNKGRRKRKITGLTGEEE